MGLAPFFWRLRANLPQNLPSPNSASWGKKKSFKFPLLCENVRVLRFRKVPPRPDLSSLTSCFGDKQWQKNSGSARESIAGMRRGARPGFLWDRLVPGFFVDDESPSSSSTFLASYFCPISGLSSSLAPFLCLSREGGGSFSSGLPRSDYCRRETWLEYYVSIVTFISLNSPRGVI